MESGLESAGALATAAAAASVIDPTASPVEGHGECLNCGAPVSGAYCSNCGQKVHLHRSVFHAVEELLHGILHFDSKLWHTLPLLLFRPGKLTWEYVHGRRARFISPVALFLLTIFTMFFVFGILGSRLAPGGVEALTNPVVRAETLTKASDQIAQLEVQLKAAEADPAQQAKVPQLKEALNASKMVREQLEKGDDLFVADGQTLGEVLTRNAYNGGFDLGNKELEDKVRKAISQPEFVFYKMQQKGYKLSFLLVPLSLPWMWLLFLGRRDVHLYDHVVFLLYSISFMSLLFMVGAVLAGVGIQNGAIYVLLFLVVPVVHIFAQLKGGYRLTSWGAAWRTSILSILAFVTLVGYFIGILLLGLLE